MNFHLLTLALQKDMPDLSYEQALETIEAWRANFVASYNAASTAHSYYKHKFARGEGEEAAELIAQAIIVGTMRFALSRDGNQLTVETVQ